MKRSQIQRKTQLRQTKPINQRSKHNKHRHVSNKRIDHSLGFVPCTVCEWLYGTDNARGACHTHEVFYDGSSYMRNTSRDYGAQEKVCIEHDEEIHRTDHVLDRKLKVKHQMRIMLDFDISIDEFRDIFNGNWLNRIE